MGSGKPKFHGNVVYWLWCVKGNGDVHMVDEPKIYVSPQVKFTSVRYDGTGERRAKGNSCENQSTRRKQTEDHRQNDIKSVY